MKLKILKKLNKLSTKTAFSLVEITAALAISSLSLVAIAKISYQSTQLAVQNDAMDKAINIASRTSETLLKFRGNIGGVDNNIQYQLPEIYYACGGILQGIGNNYSQQQYDLKIAKFQEVYFHKDTSTTPNTIGLLTPNNGIYQDATTVPVIVDQLSQYSTSELTFVKDNLLKDTTTSIAGERDIFYRYTALQYNYKYKIMNALIIVYWNLYGENHFYISYPTFSLASNCQ